ncbi:MAG: hypothetical protein KBS95_06085 [Alistipes sp.]|nr:hypothetical protein [Candidatus Alistipes equi]
MSRTVMGESDGVSQSVNWCVGDEIAVWARPVGTSSPYTLDKTIFRLATFNATYSSADFKATIDEMPQGRYDYVAFYPVPTQTDESAVSYSIPEVQDGDFGAENDIMYASCEGNALQIRDTSSDTVDILNEQPELSFKHMMHLIRIRVPEGKNLFGSTVKKLVITFPQNVVGKVTIDMHHPETQLWSELRNELTIDMDSSNQLDANGRYVWAYVRPTTLNGEITFRAYDTNGIPSKLLTTSINKTLLAQHITPIALTIPQKINPVYFTFKCPNNASLPNNLGEPVNKMIVTQWPNGIESALGTNNISSTTSTSNTFQVPFYYDEELGINKALPGGVMKVTFESENVLLEDTTYEFKLPTTIMPSGDSFDFSIPWLLAEDFSNLKGYTDEATTGSKDLTGVGLPGWTASRTNGDKGKVSLRPFWVFGARFQGRLDSCPLSRIKEGHSVKVQIFFYASAEKVKTPLQVGWHTTTGSIEASESITNVSSTVSLPKGGSLTEYNVTTSKLTSKARIAWRTNITSGTWGTYSDTPISNVRIKVAQ